MRQSDFELFAQQFLNESKGVLFNKGYDYAKDQDHFDNFKQVGAFSGTTPQQAWVQGFYKHASRIFKWVRSGNVSSESLEDSIKDAINYLVLLAGYALEDVPVTAHSVREAEKDVVTVDLGAGRAVDVPGQYKLFTDKYGNRRYGKEETL